MSVTRRHRRGALCEKTYPQRRRGRFVVAVVAVVLVSAVLAPVAYGVAVRSGDVAMIGDTDFLTPESAYVADNEVLVGNIADFLVSGDKTENAPAPPSEGPGPGGSAPAPPRPPTEPTA
jgi:hypothetical protein